MIEAKKRGGTLRTARFAQAQGRLLLAYQWEQMNEVREETQALIQDGAVPFVSSEIKRVVDMLQRKTRGGIGAPFCSNATQTGNQSISQMPR